MSTNDELYFLTTSYALNDLGAFNIPSSGLDLASCNFPFTMLPVTWQNFSTTLQNNNLVSVSWTVSQQTDNKGYYVERSTDGANWDELGFVANSSTLKTSEQYAFFDNKP